MPMITKIGIIFLMLISPVLRAQTVAEWVSQKSTQKQYLLQQIAALQVYSKYLKSGYDIAKGGLGSISGSLKSENGLHSAYYSRLKTASAPVKNNAMVKEILTLEKDILTRVQQLNKETTFSPDEKNYLVSVTASVLKDSDQQLKIMSGIIQDGEMEMSDADRISLLNKVRAEMTENYRFIDAFATQVRVYALQKQSAQKQILTTQKLYGFK